MKAVTAKVFTTTRCSKCPSFKAKVESMCAPNKIDVFDETHSLWKLECDRNKIMSVPTAIFYDVDTNDICGRASDLAELFSLKF